MSLITNKDREATIERMLSDGPPALYDFYYIETVRNEIKRLQHQEDLLKTATYEGAA